MNIKTLKNRVLSVVLTAIMVFSMLPLSAFAAESGNVAEVTIGGTATLYTDIDEAFAAAQKAESATVKLLANVTIDHTKDDDSDNDKYGIELEKGNITLDLNGKTISQRVVDQFYAYSAVFYLSVPEAESSDDFATVLRATTSLTVQDNSAGGGKIEQPNGGPAIVATFNSTLTVNSGTIENTSSDDFDDERDHHMIPNCAVLVTGGGKAVINGGTLHGMRGVAVAGYITKEETELIREIYGVEYSNELFGNELTVTGGNIQGTGGHALVVYEKAKKIELFGGTFSSNDTHSIWVADSEPDGAALKGDAASLLADGYRYEYNGAECAYSAEGNGVVGNATVAKRPVNETAYIGADGKLTARANCTEITAETDDISQGWYVVKENITISGLNISEEANLILCDGATLTVTDYLNVGQGSTLNLYWQSGGSGKLTAKVSPETTITAPAGEMKKNTTGEGGTTFEKCLTHEWKYTDNSDGTHTAKCRLCGKAEAAASHKYESWTSTDADIHTGTCVCGATTTENHTLSLTPNADGLTHSTKCSVCDYATAAETHDFSSTDEFGDKKCDCGVHLAAEYNGKQYATLESAVAAAKDGDTVTLQAATVTENITIEDGTNVTIDLNGKEWTIDDMNGAAPVLIVTGGSVTVQNGTLMAGFTSKADTAVVVEGGKLTVGEGMTVLGGSDGDGSGGTRYLPAIEVKGGELVLHVGAKLDGGMKVSAEDKQLKDYLPAGMAFHKVLRDGTESVADGYVPELSGRFTLVVREHSHSYNAEGKCDCGVKHRHTGGTASYFKKAVCTVCGNEYGELPMDTTPPTGTIAVKERTPFQTFINKITFGLFFKADVTATVTAEDDSYTQVGYDASKHTVKIEYLISDKELTDKELQAQTFTEYTKTIDLTDEQSYVVYAKLTDHAGNAAYISSKSFVIDKTAPSINGYHGRQTVYVCGTEPFEVGVYDENLKEVSVNGVEKGLDETFTFTYSLSGDNTYTVVAADQAENTSSITFILREAHDFNTDTGTCLYCGVDPAVNVQVGDELYPFGSFEEAWRAWWYLGEADLPVRIILLQNADPESVGLTFRDRELTLDLNGHMFGDSNKVFSVMADEGSTCKFTVTGNGSFFSKLQVGTNGHLTVEAGAGYIERLEILHNKLGETSPTDWTVALKGGKFGSIDLRYTDRDGNEQTAGKLGDLLAPGYVFKTDVASLSTANDVEIEACPGHIWNNGKCERCKLACTHNWVGSKCTVCGYECLHSSVEERGGNTYCKEKCGQQMAVKVEYVGVNGTQQTKYYAQTYYTLKGVDYENTLQTVLNDDTATPSGSTVTLLANDLLAFAFVNDGKNIKLDLNGKNLIETVNNGIAVDTGSTLTVTGEGSSTPPDDLAKDQSSYVFNVRGGTLVFKEMEFGGTFNGIRVGSGTLTSPRELEDAIHIGTLQIADSDAKISFKAAAFGKIKIDEGATGVKVRLGDLLGVWKDATGNTVRSGNAFQNADGKLLRYNTEITKDSYVENVKTAACTHDSVTGRTCDYCGTENLVAAVIDGGGSIATFAAEDDSEAAKTKSAGYALNWWSQNGNSKSLKLFVDVALTDGMLLNAIKHPATDKPIKTNRIIDLNGHTFTGGDGNANGMSVNDLVTLTVKDSSAVKGSFSADVTVNNGAALTVDGVKVGNVTLNHGCMFTDKGGSYGSITAESCNLIDFLPEGYAFVGTDGKVKNARTAMLKNVTVARHTDHSYDWNTATHEHICGCGYVDKTDPDAPIFTDVENNGTYYNNKLTFTVNDAISGVKEVKDGGKLLTVDANGKYAITADNKEHTVTATDLAGNTATVNITVYKVYNVTLPNGEGYTVTGSNTAKHGQPYSFSVTVKEGYTATDDFVVGVKGISSFAIPQPDSTDTYNFVLPGTKATGDLEITVEGVADITAPENAEMTIGTNKFMSFLSKITFGLFFKNTQTVTVTASDKGSGVKTVEYLLSNEKFDKASDVTGEWTSVSFKSGTGSFSISPNAKGSVYVRVTDNAGNATVINSEGVVVYTDSTADTENITFTRLSDEDKSFKVNLNGNTVKSLSCGGSEISNTLYTVEADGTITLKNDWLKTLAAGEYTVTVAYNPMGEAYAEKNGNDAPATTAVKLTVLKNTRSLTFEAPNAVYDGKEYDGLRITDKPGSTAVQYKKQSAEGSTYTTDAPKNVGNYTVRISVNTDENYNAATFTKDFTISKAEVTVGGLTAYNKVYNGNTEAAVKGTATLSTNYDGENLTVIQGKANFADKNVGNDKTVTFSGFRLGGSAKDNYKLKSQPQSVTANITAKELNVANLKVKDKLYDGTAKAEIDGTPTLTGVEGSDTVQLVCGKPSFIQATANDNAPIEVSFTEFTLSGTDSGNYTVARPTGITAHIKSWNADKNMYTTTTQDWSNKPFTVTANDGYLLSLTDTADGKWVTSLTGSETAARNYNYLTFYVKDAATGTISTSNRYSYLYETAAPTGTITFNESTSFQKFLNTITFGLFYKDDVTVRLTANDEASGVKSVEYYKSDKALSIEELKAVTDWTVGKSFGITAEDMKRFVIYACITDNAGNVTYISSDGAEFDTAPPKIIGVENGKTYYVTQRITITDRNLSSVTVNGEPVSTSFDLVGDKDAVYTVIATDKAGNASEYTVTAKPITDITDKIKNITEENVKSGNAEDIKAVEQQLLGIVSESEEAVIGEEQWIKLQTAAKHCKALQVRIAATAAESSRLTNTVGDYDIDKISNADKTDIEQLITDIDTLLSGENLTDTERAATEALRGTAKVMLDRISAAKTAAENGEITATEDITESNVTADDKDALKKAENALENALKSFGGNYTEEEHKNMEDALNTVKEALKAIENAEKVAEEIKKLPSVDKVKLSDKNEIERIKKLIDSLTENEKAMIGEEALGRVKGVFEQIEALTAKAKSPKTGDTHNLTLWFALLFISMSGAGITRAVGVRKKSYKNNRP